MKWILTLIGVVGLVSSTTVSVIGCGTAVINKNQSTFESLLQKVNQLEQRLKQSEIDKEQQNSDIANWKEEINYLKFLIEKLYNEHQRYEKLITDLRADLADYQQKHSQLYAQFVISKEQIKKLEEELINLKNNEKTSVDNINKLDKQIQKTKDQNELLAIEIDKLETHIKQKSNMIETLQEGINDNNDDKIEVDRILNEISKKIDNLIQEMNLEL